MIPSPTLSVFASNAMPCVDSSPAATVQVNSSVLVAVTARAVSKVMSRSPPAPGTSRSASPGLPATSTGWWNVTRARTTSPTL